jgi:CO dehydrogenase maturation factor
VVDSISKNYRYVVIDNEAGLEHLSRRTTRDVQHMLVVTDPTQRGLVAAERIAGFRKDMDIHIENAELILNRMNGAVPAALQQRIDDMDLPLLGVIPADTELMEFEFSGRPLVELGDDSPVFAAVSEMMQKIVAH